MQIDAGRALHRRVSGGTVRAARGAAAAFAAHCSLSPAPSQPACFFVTRPRLLPAG